MERARDSRMRADFVTERDACFLAFFRSERAEKLTLFRNEASRRVLRDFLGYDLGRKNGNYVEGATTSITRVHTWMRSLIR